jgi:hypothetical protein
MALVELDAEADGLAPGTGWSQLMIRGEDVSFVVLAAGDGVGLILRSGADRDLRFASPGAAAAAYAKIRAAM